MIQQPHHVNSRTTYDSACSTECENFVHIRKGLSLRTPFSTETGVFKMFTKFAGKYLYQSLFFNKVAGLRPGVL